MQDPSGPNLNLRRKRLPGLLVLCAAPFLVLLSAPLRRRRAPGAPLLVFSAYMIGDLFMALPALKRLSAAGPLRVLCRPDCVKLLRNEGLDPVPFDNAFFTRKTPAAFLRTWRSAWKLRRLPAAEVLDLDADPRTAFWMRVAGISRIVSFRRSYGVFFDETFELPRGAIHQADKDMAVAEEFLRGNAGIVGSRESGVGRGEATGIAPMPVPRFLGPSPVTRHPPPANEEPPGNNPPWLLSIWTRKAEKNWPLGHWDEFMKRMEAGGIPFAILEAPDGDAGFRSFVAKRRGRVGIVSGPIESVAESVRESAGVVATDNFLGHMAGYYGKPVLWINVSSPASQVEPRGPRTLRVGDGGPGRPVLPGVEEAWSRFGELRG